VFHSWLYIHQAAMNIEPVLRLGIMRAARRGTLCIWRWNPILFIFSNGLKYVETRIGGGCFGY
jgi:hypothetical protein